MVNIVSKGFLNTSYSVIDEHIILVEIVAIHHGYGAESEQRCYGIQDNKEVM